ncbi:survival protein sure-like phosphatase/nucleotidase [Mycena metata]|uniref:Survival protein sure-like phosphatase/nucleotidase n=1 Tax=Mycena metata TaxID=1033252 RepID=A0AAD7HCH2_9AGAR|nr:survival protein sure-like phosphatase/nucleotidase [Mycena metata]
MFSLTVVLLALASANLAQTAKNLVLTNDDGWAVAQIRAQDDALNAAGYNVVLSCPAVDKSGTGSSTTTPTVLTTPCEFNTCPTGSPATGFNASNTRLNYVNAFPVDAARFGIQTLAPQFFSGSKPDFVVSGPNVGNNLGSTVLISGTVGAASQAALEGIPSAAFSAATAAQLSYTTLTSSPTSTDSKAAVIYSSLSVQLLNVLLASSAPILPAGISLNVNYPSTSSCTSASAFKFVLTRINSNSGATDVETCGTDHLPTESVFNASTKADVNAATQGIVLAKLTSILACSN